jgi:hypothetical protein
MPQLTFVPRGARLSAGLAAGRAGAIVLAALYIAVRDARGAFLTG